MKTLLKHIFAKEYTGKPFRLFGPAHLIAVSIIIAINLSFLWLRPVSARHLQILCRNGLIGVWLVNEIVRHIWLWRTGLWTIQTSLPLHLCPLTGYLGVILLFTGNVWLYEFVYFMGVSANGISLFTPDLDRYGFPHYKFFLFFIGHGLPLTMALYITIVAGYQPASFTAIVRIFVEINIVMLCVGIVNAFIGSNYIFLARKPETFSLLGVLGPWPWYIAGMEIVGWIACFLLYLPFVF